MTCPVGSAGPAPSSKLLAPTVRGGKVRIPGSPGRGTGLSPAAGRLASGQRTSDTFTGWHSLPTHSCPNAKFGQSAQGPDPFAQVHASPSPPLFQETQFTLPLAAALMLKGAVSGFNVIVPGSAPVPVPLNSVTESVVSKSSLPHELPKAEGAGRAIFEGSTELMRERDGPAADGFECSELEVELGVDAVDLRALHERVHHRGDLGAALGARAEMILSSEDDTT